MNDLPLWMQHNPDPATIEDVVVHINRVKPDGRRKLARDLATIAYLDAGRRIIGRYCTGGITEFGPHAYLDWLTRDVVFEEYRRGADPLPKLPSEGTFRDRWRSKNDYLADLVAYLNWSRHWEQHRELARAAASEVVDPDKPLGQVAEEIAFEDLRLATDPEHATTYMMQIALQPFAAADQSIQAAMSKMYDIYLVVWGATYERLFGDRSMKLRSDVSVQDFAIVLTAVAEGLAARAMVEGTEKIIDYDRHKSLLGTAALAMLTACVDTGDHRSLRECVDDLGRQFPPR